jgi:hypothetical protein
VLSPLGFISMKWGVSGEICLFYIKAGLLFRVLFFSVCQLYICHLYIFYVIFYVLYILIYYIYLYFTIEKF